MLPRNATERHREPDIWQSHRLRQLAEKVFARQGHGHTLQPTALVHEAHLRLFHGVPQFENREHFYRAAAQAMRRILIDWARSRASLKRGGDRKREPLFDITSSASDPSLLLDVDQVVDRLRSLRPELAEVVECRFFGGLSIDETALAVGCSSGSSTTAGRWRRSGSAVSLDPMGKGAGAND